jgi:hypothetical protein
VVGAIQAPLAVAPDGDEARVAQERQVLRHARVAQVEAVDELAHRHLVAPDQAKDLLPARLGDELQRIHADTLPQTEMFCYRFAHR